MIQELLNLRRRPFILSECMLGGFLFFFLVLSGPKFGKMATLCGGLSVLFFGIELVLRNQTASALTKVKPLVPYFLLSVLTVLVLPLIPFAASRVWNIFTGILILIVVFTITRRYGRAQILEYAFPMVVCGLCFLMLVAPSLVGAEASTQHVSGRVNYRTTGLGEGGGLLSSHFSVIVGIAIFLSLLSLIQGGFHWRKLLTLNGMFHSFTVALGFYLVVILSGSRQGLFWWFFFALFCYAMYTKRQLFLGILFLIPLTLISLTVGYIVLQDTLVVQRIIAIFDPVAQTFNPEKSLEGRIEMIKIGLDLWKESPVWGNGNEAFRVNSGINAYSHNNYVELLANYGIMGAIFFYLPLVVALIMSLKGFFRVRHPQLKNDYLWVLFCVVSVLVSNFFMPSYYMKHMLMFLGVILGRLYYIREMEFSGRPMQSVRRRI